jgi:hypothetical protein
MVRLKENEEKLKIGNKVGKLTILKISDRNGKYGRNYDCRCDCGKIKTISRLYLLNGVKSCGCLRMEIKNNGYLPDNRRFINTIISSYKIHAKHLNIPWLLTYKEVEQLLDGSCVYCGIRKGNKKISGKSIHRIFQYNGIDRIDSSSGYTKDNCVSCCIMCNKAKRKASKEKFLTWIQRVYNYSFLNKLSDVDSIK